VYYLEIIHLRAWENSAVKQMNLEIILIEFFSIFLLAFQNTKMLKKQIFLLFYPFCFSNFTLDDINYELLPAETKTEDVENFLKFVNQHEIRPEPKISWDCHIDNFELHGLSRCHPWSIDDITCDCGETTVDGFGSNIK